MKKKIAIAISAIIVLAIAGMIAFAAYRSSEGYRQKEASETYKMTGTVLEIRDGTMIVEPIEGEDELSSSDMFDVSTENMSFSSEPQVGDIVEVTYNGDIEEIYPAVLGGVTSIRIVSSASDDTK